MDIDVEHAREVMMHGRTTAPETFAGGKLEMQRPASDLMEPFARQSTTDTHLASQH